MKTIPPEKFEGVWSAAPTPFDDKMRIDVASVKRLVEHHLRLGVKGVFLAGTCGEGAWMPERDRRTLVQATVAAAKGRLVISVQVTDNSAARILDNMALAQEDGADMAVIAPPYFLMNATPANVQNLYVEAIRKSPLPVGIYDRGTHSSVSVPDTVLKALYAEPNVVSIKDSSSDPVRRDIALAARRKRPELRLLTGNEFMCVEYLEAGYDGLMLGGAAFQGHLAGLIMQAVAEGNLPLARRLEERMIRIMYAVYGGKKIKCWLSGEKKILVDLGVFKTWKSYLNYPLTDSCCRAIEGVLAKDADVLLPSQKKSRGTKTNA
jgi:4-hydroxy-tetrahydrodipicolinate synthase